MRGDRSLFGAGLIYNVLALYIGKSTFGTPKLVHYSDLEVISIVFFIQSVLK